MFFFILVLICGWGYNKVKDGGPKEDCTKRPDWMPEPGWENVRQKGWNRYRVCMGGCVIWKRRKEKAVKTEGYIMAPHVWHLYGFFLLHLFSAAVKRAGE